ncbi:Lrp/AsnC family transcriptional regulator [Clostridium botulinum C]|uniref:Lrp/AsnC family transcriptional regulator n=2 Tax=Clostridium botulinum TaxID=1491 RepID=A0A9Q4XVU4_CLOBO|nr:Lrp/AsnC family transcriptional regulator [Clostridium botulinum]EGO87245.1 AsnC family transcriptional regulator [Clostridium botulinum C str. Stockholm]MCD3195569.1 Lrp/AsnC family transcriptional regulator [Clostridium botulinum C]MCD3200985.1 Lrp/AsnC family transcriptional regulator [Clostridium botulinum C]MCD3206393.1 Lrp/AsnC family transcriptional regulator [Clostridium botulinum C]MCD3208845.1 Lrp/AsnC family transcriptional regulator [Clostridium botulinum C]
MEEILEILEKNSKYNEEEIAAMTGKSVEEVKKAIKKYEEDNIIVGYPTLINWEKTSKDSVVALIQVKVTPQRGEGFDKVAERIYRFSEVKSCYLMSSGGFDLNVIVEGKTMKEVALFVAEKLATQEAVLSTSTHFILKKYKDKGTIFEKKTRDDREAIFI